MKSHYFSVAFAIAAVATGVAIMSASFSGASPNQAAHNPPPTAAADSGDDKGRSVASVASLVGGLENRLRETPDDGKGWLLLAKSYRHLGRLEDAREAYGKADTLGHGDPVVAEQLFGPSPANTAVLKNSN